MLIFRILRQEFQSEHRNSAGKMAKAQEVIEEQCFLELIAQEAHRQFRLLVLFHETESAWIFNPLNQV